jgi:hypothetical protein
MPTFLYLILGIWLLTSTETDCVASSTCNERSERVPNVTADCMPPAAATQLVNDYIYHIAQNFSESIAQAAIAENATVTSQSANALKGKNMSDGLDGPTFEGKAAIIAGETSQPKTLELISIDAIDCTAIAFRWWGIPGSPSNAAVKAISIFQVAKQKCGTWQITEIFGEFYSVTWGEDTGASVTLPPPPA